jgi:hypothetical protein
MWRAQSKPILVLLLLARAGSLSAAPVPDLYSAQVPSTALSGPGLDAAFAAALDEVLVKVTGERFVAADPRRRVALGPAAALVRQYQPLPAGQVRVSFDPAALRRRLDAANLPVWPDDRPRTLVILPPGEAAGPEVRPGDPPASPLMASAAGQLLAAAASRGVPMILQAEPASGASGTRDPLLDPGALLQSAGADALLVGQRAGESGPAQWRWTLVRDGARTEWQGDAADGAHGLADRLAARYATSAAAGRVLRLRIDGVGSFDDYARLQAYLRGVGLIQSAELLGLTGDDLLFVVGVRGDVVQLNDAFALQRVLEPVSPDGPAGAPGELAYRLVQQP